MLTQHPLKINNVSKSFKDNTVLDNISFSVEKGEIFGLIGLNGIGKTTLIKIMLDLLNADAGTVEFFGVNAQSPESRKNICYLPEKFYPSPFLKGEEFLALSMDYIGKELDLEKATQIAEILNLKPEVLKNKVSKYSKGMGQKLGLMSVFLSEAPLLILDEPMSGLDPSSRIELKNLLKNYSKTDSKTIFFSSHILSDIDEICNRIAVIHASKLIFLGKPNEFKEKYKSESLEQAFLNSISIAA
jgi:ABC-2 type transport system ATP-binding protein